MTKPNRVLAAFACGVLLGAAQTLVADQITLQNGDTIRGKVVAVGASNVVFQSDMLGQVTVPRAKVSAIALGATSPPTPAAIATNLSHLSPRAVSANQSNLNSDLAAALGNLGSQTNLIQQVQAQFLATAGPEANAKFNQMMSALMSGQMNLGDLRNQAKTAADQLRSYKKELGGDAGGGELDAYLGILDSFIAEVAAAPAVTATNLVKPARK